MEHEKILIIIPCFNEENSIGNLLHEITSTVKYDIVVIDDGSNDKTYCIASQLTKCVKLPINLGIGGAVQTGIRYAYENGYSYCVQVDGDGQHPPYQIPSLLEACKASSANIVIGSRFIAKSEFLSTTFRRMGIKLISFVINMLFGKRLTDPTSGFRLMDRKAMELFSNEYPTDFPEPISIAMAIQNKLNIIEVPVNMRERRFGNSSIVGLKPFDYMLRVLGYLFLIRIKGHV